MDDSETGPAGGLSRTPSLRSRPPLPQGPRNRLRSSNFSLDTVSASQYSRGSTLYSSGLTSPGFSPKKSPRILDTHILSAISENSTQPPPVVSADRGRHVSRVSTSSTLLVKPIPKFPVLTTPPPINFDYVPVQWKGLPLETVLWTFDSQVLQEIVSRAIRSSARQSFIRLLSLEDLDHALPTESERLAGLKVTTQSKYRFHVHRRTMLLQALDSFSRTPHDKDGRVVVGKLASQLSETTAECDRHLQELLQIMDQQMQIAKLQDVHWASALAIALRKLNKSYTRRTADLVDARERIEQLEAELEDAWREAERMAREMDDFSAGMISDEESGANVEIAPAVATSGSPNPEGERSANVITESPPTPAKDQSKVHSSADVEFVPDTVSIRTTRSARSTRSTRSHATDSRRSSLVSAAKRRSRRVSIGSLRLPRRRSITKTDHERPPVPDLPHMFSAEPSFLAIDSRPGSIPGDIGSTSPPEKTIDGLQVVTTPPPPLRVTVDDIEIIPRTCMIDDTQAVASTAVDDINVMTGKRMFENDRSSSGQPAIPSIWFYDDIPKTPAERVESLKRQKTDKIISYHKLKSLTKRYSFSFPSFASMSRSSSSKSGT